MGSKFLNGPKPPSGKAASLVANERAPVRVSQPKPKPTPKPKRGSPERFDPPSHSGNFRTTSVGLNPNLYDPNEHVRPLGKAWLHAADVVGGLGVGVRPSTLARVAEHPLRFAAKNRKEFKASGYRSAELTPISAHVAGAAYGTGFAGRIAEKGAKEGLATVLAGGGRKEAGNEASRVEPYVANGWEGGPDFPNKQSHKGYSYHRAPAEAFPGISEKGLVGGKPPSSEFKPAGDDHGVYFATDPLRSRSLSGKSAKGSVFLRAKRSSLRDVSERAFGEHLTPHSVPPRDLEYLGADLQWHPVAAPRGDAAKEVRDVLAGKGAFDGMGANEKVGALLDDPNLGKSAAQLQRETAKLQSAERAKRIARAEQIMNEVGGEEGHRLAAKALAGDLPKLELTAGKSLDRDNLPELFKHVQEHPELRPWERKRTRDALLKLFDGKGLQKSEIRLLGTAFGEADARALTASASLWRKLKTTGLDLLNVPRALKSSLDASALFRQALVLGAGHPVIWSKSVGPSFKTFFSENSYKDVMDAIASTPTFQKKLDSHLALTDLENIGNREESFASNLAEYVPGVRASGRNYVSFLNKFRSDAFDNYLDMAAKPHLEVHFNHGIPVLKKVTRDADEKALTDGISHWINTATGRGSLPGSLEQAAPALNGLLFSPRLIASRLNLLNPVFYAKLDPFARTQALRSVGQLIGGIGLTLYMAKLAGAKVGLDPRSSDFGKIKIGDTRIDVMGGFQQYIVFATRMLRGESVSSSTGAVEHLTGGFGKSSRGTLASRFAQQKFAPVPGFIAGWANNENFAGQPFHPGKEALLLGVPLGPLNAFQTYQQQGPAAAAADLGLSSIGFGVQTYGSKPAKGHGSRGSRFLPGSSSGNGSRFLP